MGKHVKEGQIFKVSLKGNYHVYGRVITRKYLAFYDLKTKKELPNDEIIKLPILFKLCVKLQPLTKGDWPIIGTIPLEKELQKTPDFFIQNESEEDKIYLFNSSNHPWQQLSTYEKCKSLERMIVWTKEDLEQRIEDHYAKRKNVLVEYTKIKKPK